MHHLLAQLAILFILSAITQTGAHAIPAEKTGEKTVTYHVQIGDWPDTLRPRIERVVEELTTPSTCWTITHDRVEKKRLPAGDLRCSRFVHFDSEEALRPWKRDATDAKYYLQYEEENGIARIRIQQFVWDGEKLRRAANAGFQRDLTDERGLRDLLVSWTLK